MDTESEPTCVRLSISGRVQGVYYRASCRAEAERLGLNGWVRNTRDGRVEALAEGPREAVDRLIDWCRQGPALAFVTGVEVSPEEPQGRRGFDVIH